MIFLFSNKKKEKDEKNNDIKIISKDATIHGYPHNPSFDGQNMIQHRSWNSNDNTTIIISKDGTEIPLNIKYSNISNQEIFPIGKIKNGRLINKGNFITFDVNRSSISKTGICQTMGDRSGCVLNLIDYPEGTRYLSNSNNEWIHLPDNKDNSKILFIKKFEPLELVEIDLNYKSENWILGKRLHSLEGKISYNARLTLSNSIELGELKGNVHSIDITHRMSQYRKIFGRIWLSVGYYSNDNHVFILIVQDRKSNIISIHRISKIFKLGNSSKTSSLYIKDDLVSIGFGINDKISMMKNFSFTKILSEMII